MPRIAVVTVPYISCERHLLLAEQTMATVRSSSEELDLIAVVNRFRLDHSDWKWIAGTFAYAEENDRNIVARAWNKGITKALERGAEYVLVINLDVLLHSRCIDKLISFAQQHPEPLIWSPTQWNDYLTLEQAPEQDEVLSHIDASCFMVDQRLFQKIGYFDEQFEPAYHEDSDMVYRIKLAGYSIQSTKKAYFYHLGRGTIKGIVLANDMEAVKILDAQVDENLARYKQKWGGPPNGEAYTKPYNK